MDDVAVQVTDGHNLIGVSNFEVPGITSGWTSNGGPALALSTAYWHGPTSSGASLALTARGQTFHGPTYQLPLGKAKYNMSVWVLHTGTTARNLSLGGAYTCVGSSTNYYPTFASAAAVEPNTWTLLSGTNVAMPTSAAPATCRLATASMYVQQDYASSCTAAGECPNIYIDDALLTVVN
jgi:hypothetical protein